MNNRGNKVFVILALGLLASGGSAFWNSVLEYLLKAKDFQANKADKEKIKVEKAEAMKQITIQKMRAINDIEIEKARQLKDIEIGKINAIDRKQP